MKVKENKEININGENMKFNNIELNENNKNQMKIKKRIKIFKMNKAKRMKKHI